MDFEWDEDKRLANVGKHGIDFAAATTIWNDQVIDPYIERTVGDETRMIALGITATDETIIAVVYAWRDGRRRIISARRARRYERENYQGAIGRGR